MPPGGGQGQKGIPIKPVGIPIDLKGFLVSLRPHLAPKAIKTIDLTQDARVEHSLFFKKDLGQGQAGKYFLIYTS